VFKWIPKIMDGTELSNNGKTLAFKGSGFLSCEEKKKVLVNGLKTNRKENEFIKEYKWKIRIDEYKYICVGFSLSDFEYDWGREISLQPKSVIICKIL
jgi:hypothetical protein